MMEKKWKWALGIFLILVIGFFALPMSIASDVTIHLAFTQMHAIILGIAILGVSAGLVAIVGDKK